MSRLLAVFLFVLIIGYAAVALADINEYLQKHNQIKVTQSQRDRLLQYNDLIEYFCALPYSSSSRVDVHPDFIKALILAESNGDPQAVSSKNARGLTQILFSTGKEAATAILNNPALDLEQLEYIHKTKLEQLTPQDLHDPAINIMLACYLISKYNNQYKGRLDLVVSAWNAGSGSIRCHQPPNYTETLNLIGKVNGIFHFFLKKTTH